MTPKSAESQYLGLKIAASLLMLAVTIYAHIERQNELTLLRLKIPAAAKELKEIEEENQALRYEIDSFQHPKHLQALLQRPEFSHLTYIAEDRVLILPSQPPLSNVSVHGQR